MEKILQNRFIKKKYLFLIVGFFILYSFYPMWLFSKYYNWDSGIDYVFVKSVRQPLFFLFWIFLIPLVLLFKERFPFSKSSPKHIIAHIFFCFFLSIVIEFLSEFLTISVLYLFDNPLYLEKLERVFEIYYIMLVDISLMNIVVYCLIISYQSSLDYFTKFKTEMLRRTEAENLIVKAELNALKMQIQPHFLFNTLHSVSSLIDEDKEEAQDVIGRLGELLRYTLDQESDFIPLKTEIEFIKNYLEIEKIRFKERLNIDYSIESGTEDLLVASFILQPLIENAIKHGLSKSNKICTLRIHSKIDNEKLLIEISDDGNGSQSIEKGIGLKNTENRLKNYYGNAYEFHIDNLSPNGFRVIMKIPIKRESALDETH